MFHRIAFLVVSTGLLTPVQAQSFNVNFETASTAIPADSHGAAASQPGRWNRVNLTGGASHSLKLLNGLHAGCLSLKPSKALNTMRWPDSTTKAPLEHLMDSFAQVPPPGADIVVSGMRPGSYSVWVYARHAISCKYSCTIPLYTDISVNGSSFQGCGGGAPGITYAPGASYRKFNVTVTSAGKLTIHVKPKSGSAYGAINGFQVKCLGTSAQCACALSASPVTAHFADGSGGVLPVGNPVHHLQVHHELFGTVADFTGIAFRRDAFATAPNASATVVDLEMWAGLGSLSRINAVFKQSYTSTPTQVIRRKRFNLPDWRTRPRQAPAPFDFVLKYDRPFRYSGRGDFVWELIQHSRAQGGHPLDVHHSSRSKSGGSAVYGTGCTLPGHTRPLASDIQVSTHLGPPSNTWSLAGSIQNAAARSACGFLFGFRDISIPFPLPCSSRMRLYTDSSFVLPGQANANGSYRTPPISGPYSNAFHGLRLYSQCVSIQQNSLAFSNGVTSPVPSLPQPGPYAWVRATGSTSTQGQIGNGSAIVTKFLR